MSDTPRHASSISSDFVHAIRSQGLTPPASIVADGKIHRFRSGPEHSDNGFYRLQIVPAHGGGEIGFGLIGCWKRDVNEKWCSRDKRSLTGHDRAAIKKAAEERQAEGEKLAAEAAKKAEWIWKKASPAVAGHPYLVAKGIGPRGLKEYKGSLVVPVYCDGNLTSLQFIGPDGSKKFLSGGQIEGGYASIAGGSQDRSRIIIAEGYATAASLFQATGLPCVVAFNAGNLLAVAEAIRAKYPEAAIVIAADNDRHTVVRGKPLNVGIEKAKAAADAIGALVSWPVFPADAPDSFSDWNDHHKAYGPERTVAAFEGRDPVWGDAPEGPPPMSEVPIEAYESPDGPCAPPARQWASDDWRERLIAGKEVAEGHPFPFEAKSKTNAYLFLRHHQRFEGLLCYNEFSDAMMLVRQPPWPEKDFAPRPIRDDDFFMLAAQLEYCGIKVGKDVAADAAIRVAKDNAINPPREFLSRLDWDGTPRLNSWLSYYLGADSQPAEYLSMVGAKWLIGAVSRVFEPGKKFDSVLILEGTQGLGKSMALRALATFGGEEFFLDSVGDISSKDTLMTMQGKLIVEIAELASFRRSENEEIKAFITRQVDEYRPPYGRTVLKRPRYFVLAASTNELDDGYFSDDTGNRRFWPVKCGGIDVEALERDAMQLWAEAVARYKSDERTWLTREEAVLASHEQKQRFMEDAWQERIAEIVRFEAAMKIDDVLTKLELKPKDINNIVKKRVKNSLKQLGWYETRRAGEGRVWRPGEGVVRAVPPKPVESGDLFSDSLIEG
jgi:putative DNA primase/helicase